MKDNTINPVRNNVANMLINSRETTPISNGVKFVFWGTGSFAVKILETLSKNGYIPSLIVTFPDKPKGRKMVLTPTPVKIWSEQNNVKYIQAHDVKTLVEHLSSGNYDLFIVAEYGKILPNDIISMPKYKTLNVHPSLLPKFRGPSPIRAFMLGNEKETGTTIILMDEEMDHGPILKSEKLKMKSENLHYKQLEKELAELGGQILSEIIPNWISGKIKPQEQDHTKATYMEKIKKEDGLITWEDPISLTEKKIRAFTPWPGTYFFVEKNNKKMRIIITEATIENGKLSIKKIKPEGKKEMPFRDFLKGNKEIASQIKF